ELEIRVRELNYRLAQAQSFRNNIQWLQTYYDQLLLMLKNVDFSKNVQRERLSVLQAATPGRPEDRNFALRIVLAVVGSLGLILACYLLDDRFVSVRDIKDQFGEMVLGLVPQIRLPGRKPEAALLQEGDPRLNYAEAYRHLRSALFFAPFGEKRPQTLLVTGAAPAEGKSTVAANLARVVARAGMRVVLVDADIQGRALDHWFEQTEKPGLLEFLLGESDANQIQHASEVPGLTLVPVGNANGTMEGIFLKPRLTLLLAELQRHYDFVILDAGPVLAVDDPASLVPHVDAVVMVVR